MAVINELRLLWTHLMFASSDINRSGTETLFELQLSWRPGQERPAADRRVVQMSHECLLGVWGLRLQTLNHPSALTAGIITTHTVIFLCFLLLSWWNNRSPLNVSIYWELSLPPLVSGFPPCSWLTLKWIPIDRSLMSAQSVSLCTN